MGIDIRAFFDAFDAATADRRGIPCHLVVMVYAKSTFLPDIPRENHKFDFEIAPVRDAGSLSSAEARHIFEEEKKLLVESPWRDRFVTRYLERLKAVAAPKLVAVQQYYPDIVYRFWQAAEWSDYVLLLDGNRRFGAALRGNKEPLPGRGIYFDLAHALVMAEWG